MAGRDCGARFAARDEMTGIGHLSLDPPRRRWRMQVNSDLDQIALRVRDDAELFYAYRRHRLEPHGLPDSTRAVVVDLVRYAADGLFAARLAGILFVFDAHG